MITTLPTLIAREGIYNPALTAFGGGSQTPYNDSGSLLAQLVVTLWRTVITLGGLAVLLFLLWGGLSWLTSGGDKTKVEAARDRITSALVGMAILFASLAIVNFVGPAIGFDLLKLEFPNNLNL